MPAWRRRVFGWARRVDTRGSARRTALIAFWTVRLLLGVGLVLYGFSLVGPPPVEPLALEADDAPDAVASDAVHNLRATAYRVTIEAERAEAGGERTAIYHERRTIDNGGHRYATQIERGTALANESIDGERRYGTETTGYAHPGGVGGNWTRVPRQRYHPSRNAFDGTVQINGSAATVVSNTSSTYAVRLEDRSVVREAVDLPSQTQRREGNWTATLTLTVDTERERLTRAVYTYRGPAGDPLVRATYRFEYGWGVDVDRPLGTYPPGEELFPRLDLGIHAVESFLREVSP